MKRRLSIGLGIIVGVAVLLTGVHWWAQRKATQVMNAQLRERSRAVVTNPESLTVTNAPIRLRGARKATIPSVEISGHDVATTSGVTFKSVHVTLDNIEMEGGATRKAGVESGSFELVIGEEEMTRLLRERGSFSARGVKVSLEKATVTLSKGDGVVITGANSIAGKQIGITVKGALIADQSSGGIRFTPTAIDVDGLPGAGTQALKAAKMGFLLPSAIHPQFVKHVTEVEIRDGEVAFRGALDPQKFDPTALMR